MESLTCFEIIKFSKQELISIQAAFVANHGIFGTLVLVFFVNFLTFQGVLEYVQDIQPYREIDTDYFRGLE